MTGSAGESRYVLRLGAIPQFFRGGYAPIVFFSSKGNLLFLCFIHQDEPRIQPKVPDPLIAWHHSISLTPFSLNAKHHIRRHALLAERRRGPIEPPAHAPHTIARPHRVHSKTA